jgi:diadenosine tetraphosphate (Ap4A) HIT family hydrolase
MTDTIFDKIVRGEVDAWKVWESDTHLAFLTPFPNTPGFTVVIPKRNIGDYVFELTDDEYVALMTATRTVAKLLEKALGAPRVALVFEGTGVAYVHAKLIPLHGDLASQTNVWSKDTHFAELYEGHITTAEGPKMSDERLREIRDKVVAAND